MDNGHSQEIDNWRNLFIYFERYGSKNLLLMLKVNIGNDREISQSERNFHFKNQGGKTKVTIFQILCCFIPYLIT